MLCSTWPSKGVSIKDEHWVVSNGVATESVSDWRARNSASAEVFGRYSLEKLGAGYSLNSFGANIAAGWELQLANKTWAPKSMYLVCSRKVSTAAGKPVLLAKRKKLEGATSSSHSTGKSKHKSDGQEAIQPKKRMTKKGQEAAKASEANGSETKPAVPDETDPITPQKQQPPLDADETPPQKPAPKARSKAAKAKAKAEASPLKGGKAEPIKAKAKAVRKRNSSTVAQATLKFPRKAAAKTCKRAKLNEKDSTSSSSSDADDADNLGKDADNLAKDLEAELSSLINPLEASQDVS